MMPGASTTAGKKRGQEPGCKQGRPNWQQQRGWGEELGLSGPGQEALRGEIEE